MTPAIQHNIGAYVAPVPSVFPQSSAAATVNGSSIDRLAHNMPLSAVLQLVVGAVGGAPSAVTVQSTLQHSSDNATWTNYTPDGAASAAQTSAVSAASTQTTLAVDLSGANRYLRVVTTVAFTGGTSPTALIAANLVLGGEPLVPAV